MGAKHALAPLSNQARIALILFAGAFLGVAGMVFALVIGVRRLIGNHR